MVSAGDEPQCDTTCGNQKVEIVSTSATGPQGVSLKTLQRRIWLEPGLTVGFLITSGQSGSVVKLIVFAKANKKNQNLFFLIIVN